MNKREQRRAAIRWIRELMREWARQERRDHISSTTFGAMGQVLGARSMAKIGGLITDADHDRICRRVQRIIHAKVTRHPLRHLQAVNS